MSKPIRSLRWWIGGMLFASTVINYIDRQTLSTLAPFLKKEYEWSNTDYALLVVAFRVAYSFGQTIFGRLMDRVGTRRGLTYSVVAYSVASMLTSFARGLHSFAFFRFLLGAGESANWPAATKAVSEWFPRRERGLATALFDSGSSIGGAIAPFLIIPIYQHYGWRPAFIIPGLLGFIWILGWRKLGGSPETHPRITPEERAMILRDKEESAPPSTATGDRPAPRWADLLRLPQTWGVIIARSFTDPVWFFITDWFMIYLVSKGFAVENTLIAFWIPFVAADLGNFAGGGMSSWLINRGWSVERARKAVIIFGAFGMLLLIPTLQTSQLFVIAGLFAISTFAYAAYSTMAIVLATDLYADEAVATVSGMSGTGAGIGTIASTLLIGWISDRYSFGPILVAASLIPFIGMLLVMRLVRNPESGANPLLKRI
ncbi:MAG: MFS transporter [Acidobacteriota bacterium]|jgi:ACS family hexuronate transporter-like MFS transporter